MNAPAERGSQSSVAQSDLPGAPAVSEPAISEPSLAELAEALSAKVDQKGAVPAGVAERLMNEKRWGGRLLQLLEVITNDSQTMGYLAGGQRADEVTSCLSAWAESPLSLEEIRLVVASGGWDPEPFVALARAGLLEALLRSTDGSPRRIRGELAGGWVSDELALASDADVLERVRQLLDEEHASSNQPADSAPTDS